MMTTDEIYTGLNLGGLANKALHFGYLQDDKDGLKIALTDDKGICVTISYPDGVLCYRKSDEGDRLKMLGKLPDLRSCMYSVKNSRFFSWFSDQNYHAKFKAEDIRHVCIATVDDIIDILDFDDPIATVRTDDAGR